MTDILRTFTVTPAQVEAARAAAEQIPGGAGMFVSQDDDGNFVSSGYVSQELADALANLCAVTEP